MHFEMVPSEKAHPPKVPAGCAMRWSEISQGCRLFTYCQTLCWAVLLDIFRIDRWEAYKLSEIVVELYASEVRRGNVLLVIGGLIRHGDI